MARIKIENLPKDQRLSKKQLREVLGGKGMGQPVFEMREKWAMPLEQTSLADDLFRR